MSLRYLITGTGRCGTGYAAQVLTSAGVPCGHEAVFGPARPLGDAPALPAEASWMAAPYLGRNWAIPDDVRIVHLVRNPRDVIESLMRIGFFDDEPLSGHRPYLAFLNDCLGDLRERFETPFERAVGFYIEWNRIIERELAAYPHAARVRVEEGPEPILEALGIDPAGRELFDDRHYNHRGGRPVVFDLDLLPTELRADLEAIADDYGYTLEKPEAEPHVFWAVLWERNVSFQAADAFLDVAAVCMQYDYVRIAVPYMAVDDARNQITELFLAQSQSPEDTLVMLDNDHAHPHNVVSALASRPEGVVGALAFRRWPPHDPLFFVRQEDGSIRQPAEWEPGRVYECDAVGTGAIAIKRWVFDRLMREGAEPPFFRMTYGKGGTREDMTFARLCEEARIKHHCHTGVEIPHLSVAYINTDTWRRYNASKEEA